jgi:hypothetical protein
MKTLILGALISLSGMAAHASDAPLSAADKALLGSVTHGQYAALVYTVSGCGFEPTPATAVVLLKSAALPAITEAVARHTPPPLDSKACAALTKS